MEQGDNGGERWRRTWGRLYGGTRNHRKIRALRAEFPDYWFVWYVLIDMAIEIDDGGWIYLAPGVPFDNQKLSKELGIRRKDVTERLLIYLESLQLLERSPHGLRLISFNERNFKSDTSAKRTREYRERKAKQGQESPQGQPPRDVTVTHQIQSRADTEQIIISKEIINGAPDVSTCGKSNGFVYKCEAFEVDPDFLSDLLKKYPLIPEAFLIEEWFPRMRNWCLDNRKSSKHRGKFTADGRLKNPRNCLMNWLKNEDPGKIGDYGGGVQVSQPGLPEIPPGVVVPLKGCQICHGGGLDKREKPIKPCECLHEPTEDPNVAN